MVALLAVGMLLLSVVCCKPNCKSILSGLGTGLCTSLVVSLIINHAVDKRIKQEKLDAKDFIFSKVIKHAKRVYGILIWKINKFGLYSEKYPNKVYGLYEDFSKYREFEEVLNGITHSDAEDKLKKQLHELFDWPNSEIKDTPLQELLQQINPDDEEVKAFFKENSVKKELKKNRKIRRLITSQFGKKYLSNIWK